jgi:hypothetical protein
MAERHTDGLANVPVVNMPAKVEKDSFFNMGIADAAVKYLKMVDGKAQPTNTIIEVLENGGLRKSAYSTVYAILSRRANKVGDIVNVNGDWGLTERYGPGKKSRKKTGKSSIESSSTQESAEVPDAEAEAAS